METKLISTLKNGIIEINSFTLLHCFTRRRAVQLNRVFFNHIFFKSLNFYQMENLELTTQEMPTGIDFSINEAEMQKAKPVNVTPKYLELKNIGEAIFCKFVKFTTVSIADKKTGEIKALKGVILATANGFVINSGVNLINQLEKNNFAAGTSLKIELSGMAKQTKIYTIYIIP